MLRLHLCGLLCLLAACRCDGGIGSTDVEPLRVQPASLDFGSVYVGGQRSLVLTISNPARVDQTFTATAAPPFFVSAARGTVQAGSEAMLTVTFSPSSAGPAAATLFATTLSGSALAPLECGDGGACTTVRFDPDAGTCVNALAPDGIDCAPSFACFTKALCEAGTCVGTLDACDDHNVCTIDSCGALGCAHTDAIFTCPSPPNPCEHPTCDPATGCGVANVPDGTACGTRDCASAQICINGQCLMRPVPQTTTCTEVVAGRPGGLGWADGTGSGARFSNLPCLTTAPNGDIWIADYDNYLVRRLTPGGTVTTVAGAIWASESVDGFGAQAHFTLPIDIAVDSHSNVFVADFGELARPQVPRIRKLTPQGLVTTFAGGTLNSRVDGIGAAAGFKYIWGIGIGSGDVLWVVDDGFVRRVSPSGEVTTWGPTLGGPTIALAGRDEIGVADVAEVPSGLLTCDSAGIYLWPLDAGSPQWVTQSTCGRIAVADDGFIAFVGNTAGFVGVNGGTQELNLPTGNIQSITWLHSGKWAVSATSPTHGTRVQVLNNDGTVSLLAGPDDALVNGTGSIATAGLNQPSGLTELTDGTILIGNASGVDKLSAGSIDAWAQGYLAPNSQLVAIGPSVFGFGPELFVEWPVDGGAASFTGPPLEAIAACNGRLAMSSGSSGTGWYDQLPAAVAPQLHGNAITCGDSGGFYLALANTNTVVGVSSSGISFAVAGNSGAYAGQQEDGSGAAAWFGEISALARDPITGDLFLADQRPFNSLRRITPQGQVSTFATLADAPQQIFVEDGGTLLVTVPSAVLRIRP